MRRQKDSWSFVGPLAVLLLASGPAGAQDVGAEATAGRRVVAVAVRGARVVAEETILAKVQMKPGMPYEAAVVSDDIRRLFATGYFTDVQAETQPAADGLQLTFVVREKPQVSAVELSGHRVLHAKRLRELLEVREGDLYNPRAIKDGLDRIQDEYRRRGFSQSEVLSRVEPDEAANVVRLYVLVDEGPRMRVSRVLVEGNQAFADRRIRRLLKTKRRWWVLGGGYQAEVLKEDEERVRAFYRQHGYQDVAVASRVLSEPSGRRELFIHLTIDEGEPYRVGQVVLEGVQRFPEVEVRRLIGLKPGAVFSPDALREDLRLIKEYYGDRGYIKAEVDPDPRMETTAHRVHLTYRVVEGSSVTVNRVQVRGNVRTKDVVLRRELRIYPGDVFDGAKIRNSVQRLNNLGLFEEVDVATEPTSDPEREDLVVSVKEAKTGSFSFGGGFSSVDKLVGLIELEQRNFDWRNPPVFIGAGQDLRFRVEIGSVRRNFDVSFTEPWIFNRPVSFGIDAFNRTRKRSSDLGLAYEEERRGGGLRLGKEFTDELSGVVSYQLFRTEISDVITGASADLKAEAGRSNTSVVGTSLSFSAVDNRFDPTRGWTAFTSGDLAGGLFQGDNSFFRLQGGGSTYWPQSDRFVLEARARAGIVDAYDESSEVPIFERFFGGGSTTIRGFKERRVGPRDASTNDPIGGEAMALATLEEVFTVLRDERGRPILKATAFFDIGDVWRRIDEFGESFKAGAGVGARVNTPIGPLRLDVGFPISDVAGEEREPRFHFNVSRGF